MQICETYCNAIQRLLIEGYEDFQGNYVNKLLIIDITLQVENEFLS